MHVSTPVGLVLAGPDPEPDPEPPDALAVEAEVCGGELEADDGG